jgi:hypothetical protein
MNGGIICGTNGPVRVHFAEKSFNRTNLTERHLTEKSVGRTPFDRKFISSKGYLTDFFKKKVV